jgi:hypothetical protein
MQPEPRPFQLFLPPVAPLRRPPPAVLQVEKGVCEREFQHLKTCFYKAVRTYLAASR